MISRLKLDDLNFEIASCLRVANVRTDHSLVSQWVYIRKPSHYQRSEASDRSDGHSFVSHHAIHSMRAYILGVLFVRLKGGELDIIQSQ